MKIVYRGSYNLTGGGLVYVCNIKDNTSLTHKCIDLLYENKIPISLNNMDYTIRGIERMGLENKNTSDDFGLLVSEIKK